MNKIELTFDIELTNSQYELIQKAQDETKKYLLCNYSRQQGKTTAIQCLMITWLCGKNNKIGYVSKTKSLAKDVYKEIVEMLEDTSIIKSNNGTDLIIEASTGSSIRFLSAEQADNIRGKHFRYLVLDEAAFYSYDNDDDDNIWDKVLFATVKVNGKKVIMITTPQGKQGFFYKNVQYATKYPEDYDYICKTIYDDGLANDKEIEDIKNRTSSLAFRQEFMCEFLDSALTAIQGFEYCFIKYKFDFNKKLWFGVDLSGLGDDNTILTFINENKETIQYNITGGFDDKYGKIINLLKQHKENIVGGYIEDNGVGAAMVHDIITLLPLSLRNKTKTFTTTNETKQDIITLLALDVDKKEIKFNETDKALHSEFSTFTYTLTKTKKVAYGAKSGFHDDRVISVALANKALNDFKFYPNTQKTVFVGAKINSIN